MKDAARLEKTQTPRITLDHIIKERYPTFVDALRDLDDALSMLFLFANLPSTATIPPKTIALCQRLCLEFEHYLIISHSLRKSFLSIKGIYYQATIQGQDILWLVPYKFVQRVTGDVDFRIMGTFIEFYTTLLGFVNFRLYNTIGLIYPPKFNAGSDERGAELGAFTLEGKDLGTTQRLLNGTAEEETADRTPAQIEATTKAQEVANTLAASNTTESDTQPSAPINEDDNAESNAIDTFSAEAPDADILPQPTTDANTTATLFTPFTFYLSRETPRLPLEFLLKSFGCKRVGWDAVLGEGAYVSDEHDPAITHQIVDRPPIMTNTEDADGDAEMNGVPKRGGRVPGRTYVQPQWVWDCVNEGKLLRPDLYAPGATLPPHLSPWVKASRGAYDPTAPLELADEDEEEEVEAEKDESVVQGVQSVKAIADLAESSDEEDEVDEEDEEDEDELEAGIFDASDEDAASSAEEEGAKPTPAPVADDFSGFSSDDEDTEDVHARELAAELSGKPLAPAAATAGGKKQTPKQKAAARAKREKEEELERQKMMMPRRKRKLLEKMMYSNAKKEEEADKLRGKRRKVEKEAAKVQK